MARILFASTVGMGHFLPLKPLIAAFAARGDQVLVAGPPRLLPMAGNLPFAEVDAPDREEVVQLLQQLPGLPHHEGERLMGREIFGRLNTRAALPRMRDVVEEWQPDLVVRESLEVASGIAAEGAGIPHVRVGVTLFEMEALYAGAITAGIADLLDAQGLPVNATWLFGDRCATFFPASLENPEFQGPANALRLRDPGWPKRTEHSADRPLVYATLGTVIGSSPQFAPTFGEIVRAVDGLDANVLMTVGRKFDVSSLGSLPANLRVEPWVDQADAMARATAVIGHGGSGTTLGTLAAGLPMLVIPHFADQPINAARVAAIGAGRSAPPQAGAIRAELDELLRNDSYSAAAQAIAAEMAASPSADDAPELLSALG